jgi:RNA polymerase sigma-70 factor (ECF subfamily)
MANNASSSSWDEGFGLVLASTHTAGSATDLTALVETHSALLFRVAHSILRNRAEAEDVVQDAFVRVLQHHRKAHSSKLPPIRDQRVWLVRIAWNLAIDRRRRIRPDQMDETFAAALVSRTLPADEAFAEATQINAVLREIERLPQRERNALLLSAIEELTIPEVAAVLSTTESAVRALLFRARTRLRDRLEKGVRA